MQHSNKTKQDIGLTGFPKASSRVSVSPAGTNNGEAPATPATFRHTQLVLLLVGFYTEFFARGGKPFRKSKSPCRVMWVHYHCTRHAREVWGHAPPGKCRPSEMTYSAFSS